MKKHPPAGQWCLYVVRCADDSLYCGITNHLTRRIGQHNDGTGARYTRGRSPVRIVRAWCFDNRSTASKAEAAFKKLNRRAKETLLKSRRRPAPHFKRPRSPGLPRGTRGDSQRPQR